MHNKYFLFLLPFFLILSFLSIQQAYSQQVSSTKLYKEFQQKVKNADRSTFKYIPKKPGHYTAEDWRAVIDSTWGKGMSTAKKLELFDYCWDIIDKEYPSFFNIKINWDSLRTVYRPEVAAGVSRGRFSAIMNHLFTNLLDQHCTIADIAVATDGLKPGIPLMVVTGGQTFFHKTVLEQEYSHFGAGLVPMPDSSLFIYHVVDNHPLGLERGDIVLGYDGKPWKYLYKELLAAELPTFAPSTPGTNSAGATYNLLTAAGENWHLFDTIDIVKYTSGDTIHLQTSLLSDKKMYLLNTDQLPIPGVHFPDIDDGHLVSWGVVEGTQTGYIYIWDWSRNGDYSFPTVDTGDDLNQALLELIHEHNVDGLIIDSRANSGGWTNEYEKSLAILYNENQDYYDEFVRDNPSDHFSVKNFSTQFFKVNADNYLFDKPIALLIGPHSVSTGDMMPQQLRTHPMVRAFGRGTAGAFGRVLTRDISSISNDWIFRTTYTNLSLVEERGMFLTHLYIPPDEEIWLKQDDVALGEDTVAKRALEWIHNLAYSHSVSAEPSYVKPGLSPVHFTAKVENPNNHSIEVVAYISNDEAVVDSIYLTKDGAESDSIWGAAWLPSEEDIYHIAVKTDDLVDNTSRTISKVAHFTSIGPVEFDSYVVTSQDTIPNGGERPAIKSIIKNNSASKSVANIKIVVSSLDSLAEITSGTQLSIGSIDPGSSKQSGSAHYIQLSDKIDSERDIPLLLKIYSGDFHYWTDTLYFHVYPAHRPISVFPGDTDNNGKVEANDVLPIGVYFLNEGSTREQTSVNWEGKSVTSWDIPAISYADANGDGIVDEKDVVAIGVNWGNTHAANATKYQISLADSTVLNKHRDNFQIIYNALNDNTSATKEMKKLLQDVLGIEETVPQTFALYQNYPNPFNPKTVISYQLPEISQVELSIYNILGQKIAILVNESQDGGDHKYEWDASNFSSGLYFYQLKTKNGFMKTCKMLLVK